MIAPSTRTSLNTLFDVVLIASVLFATFLANRVMPFFVLGLLGPYLLQPSRIREDVAALSGPQWVFLGVLSGIAVGFAFLVLIWWEPYDPVHIFRTRALEHPFEWIFIGALAIWTFVRFNAIEGLGVLFGRVFLPVMAVGLAYAAIFYTATHLEIGPLYRACRSSLGVFNQNILAFFIAIVFSFGFSYFLLQRLKPWLPFVVVGLGYVALIVLTGSRMAILVYFVTNLLIAMIMMWREWVQIILVFVALIAGAVIGVAILEVIGCGFLGRVLVLVDAAREEESFSSVRRLDLWKIGLSELSGHWTLGLGIAADAKLSFPNAHIHNQYLSWLIWGGVPGLVLGLTLLLALPVWGWVENKSIGFAMAGACTGFAGMNFLTDSILYFSEAFAQFMILYVVIAVTVSKMARAAN